MIFGIFGKYSFGNRTGHDVIISESIKVGRIGLWIYNEFAFK